MKWAGVLIVAVLAIAFLPGATAWWNNKPVVTDPTFMPNYAAGAASGVCEITYTTTEQAIPVAGMWPYNNRCTDLPGTSKQYSLPGDSGGFAIEILTNGSHIDNYPTITFFATNPYDRWIPFSESRNLPFTGALLKSIPKDLFDDFSKTSPFPIFNLGFYGASAEIEFGTTTITPSTLPLFTIEARTAPSAPLVNKYIDTPLPNNPVVGLLGNGPGLTYPYTLPLKRQCGQYLIAITDGEGGFSNRAQTPITLTEPGNSNLHIAFTDGDNVIYVKLKFDTNNLLTKIYADIDDDADDGNGAGFSLTLYCKDLIDPDNGPADYCENTIGGGKFKWSQSVDDSTAGAGKGCCGDDETADVDQNYADVTCTHNEDGTYKWKTKAEINCGTGNESQWLSGGGCCKANPSREWITIANQWEYFTVRNQTVRFGNDTRWAYKTVDGSFRCSYQAEYFGTDPASGSEKSCQIGESNLGTLATTTSDEAVCIKNTAGKTVWLNASTNITTRISTTGRLVTSNGSKWLACVNSSIFTPTPVITRKALNTLVTNTSLACTNACPTGTECSSGKCSCPSGKQWSGTACTTIETATSVSCTENPQCTGGTTCTGTSCVCGSGQRWNGNQCVAATNQTGTDCHCELQLIECTSLCVGGPSYPACMTACGGCLPANTCSAGTTCQAVNTTHTTCVCNDQKIWDGAQCIDRVAGNGGTCSDTCQETLSGCLFGCEQTSYGCDQEAPPWSSSLCSTYSETECKSGCGDCNPCTAIGGTCGGTYCSCPDGTRWDGTSCSSVPIESGVFCSQCDRDWYTDWYTCLEKCYANPVMFCDLGCNIEHYFNCPAPLLTQCPASGTCNGAYCICDEGSTWTPVVGGGGGFCTTFSDCPLGYERVESNCIHTQTYPDVNFPYASTNQTCAIVNNTVIGTGTPYICLDKWTTYDDTKRYYFNNSDSAEKLWSTGVIIGVPGENIEGIKFTTTDPDYQVVYQAHIAYIGWVAPVKDGEWIGFPDKEIQAVRIWLQPRTETGIKLCSEIIGCGSHISYQANVEGTGWLTAVNEGGDAGTTGQSRPLYQLNMTNTGGHNISVAIHTIPKYVGTGQELADELLSQQDTVTHVCKDQTHVPALKKWNPDFSRQGICDYESQCWFNTLPCYNISGWYGDDICIQNPSIGTPDGTWTKRTQLLADALFRKANETIMDKFIIHCDSDNKTLNTNVMKKYGDYEFVNNFCVLSTYSGNTEVIGTTLNSYNGFSLRESEINNRLFYDPVRLVGSKKIPPVTLAESFISFLNTQDSNTEYIGTTADSCNNTLETPNEFSTFHACDPVTHGTVLYQVNNSILLFTTTDNYAFEQTWFTSFIDRIRLFLNNVFGSGQMPLNIPLNGDKIYIARNGTKNIQAIQHFNITGGSEALIYYTNMNVTPLCTRLSVNNCAQVSTTPLQWKVIIPNPSDAVWKAFTVDVRP